ncbi:golvesin C-terminal-like domain-containing protein [Streptomyces sp. IBSNAI001]|uniref:golvesin C-terminal-like domain-containing protein n=1 Tax=Streptomyces sp. IBSNAI001 TaxID=3457499 RepID=UPI003FD1D199
MSRRYRWRIPVITVAATALLAGYPSLSVAKSPSPPPGAAQGWSQKDEAKAEKPGPAELPEAVPAEDRTALLGSGHRASDDLAWTTSGDATGFHVMVAAADDGYRWRTAATLSEPGFDTDTWIGNACLTASGKRAAVTYAPRTFTNKPALMTRGAFTAVVDLTTGAVTKLPVQSSLSYFSPGCGTAEKAVFSQFSDDDSKRNETRLIGVDTASGKAAKPLKLPGQVTSAVPVADGYAAAQGARLVRVGSTGGVRVAAHTAGVPFQLTAAGDGSVVYIDRPGATMKVSKTGATTERAEVRRAPAALLGATGAAGTTQRLATGALTDFDLARAARTGAVYVTGTAEAAGSLPASVRMPSGVAKDAVLSTKGEAAVTTAWADGKDSRISPQEAASARTARTEMKILKTGHKVTLDARPGTTVGSVARTADGLATSPALTGGSTAAAPKLAAASPTNPVEDERYCSVPRGDVKKQAFQPTPRQVEWAVDQAVVGKLNAHVSRAANWKNTGMSAYQPQSLFPLKTMAGDPNGTPDAADGYHIPAQVMLGVTAQESNMWQATRFAVPGVTANTLIGNYYGISHGSDGQTPDPWAVNWADADCGYGIVQVTDGMRKAGHEKPGETALSVQKQEAVALDYTANIAAGVNILVDKWNQTYSAGMTVNDGGPEYIENWFFALWAYNSGFYPQSSAGSHGGHWGVGFTNNPANALWKANRTPFLENAAGGDDYSHAAHPQDWPYQEKVIGWAARPISAMFSPGDFQPGYRAAWWTDPLFRTSAKPPVGTFCDSSNNCDPSKITENDTSTNGACQLNNPSDEFFLHCWWNKKATWKNCESAATCGFALHRFDATYPEQPDGSAYPPRCSSGLPSGTYVIDDVASGVTPAGSSGRSCGSTSSPGTFGFTFTADGANYPGKIDTHQIGAGYGNHFWFGHTRNQGSAEGARMKTTGTWTLTNGMTGWARVWVHLPDHGAHTRQASYTISGTNSTSPVRVTPQRVGENKWVSLGVFQFTSTPKISLSTHAADGSGSEDVAWDAAGFQPLAGKPKDMVVAMGDSYSSGEGASAAGGVDYYKETNYRDTSNPSTRNACHRSKQAWSRQATIPGRSASVGSMDDNRSAAMDYHLIACSGARTYNIADVGENGELPQLSKGYLDQNTTLVTLSIGGNDARFAYIIQKCIFGGIGWPTLCQDQKFEDDDSHVDDAAYQGLDIGVAAERLAKERVRPAITNALKKIQAKAPNAKIVLMGYPPLLEGAGQCIPGIGTSEAPWLNSMAGTLATEMQGAVDDAKAAGTKAWYSNPAQNFAGKAVCGDPEQVHGIVLDLVESDEPAIDWPILQLGASAQSFHPKVGGARLYADSLERTMQGMGL